VDDDALPIPRTAVANAERLARVETRVEGLKEDTGKIRESIHAVNGEMQKFVFAEQRCVEALTRISEQTRDLPHLAQAMIAFTEMRPKLTGLIETDAKRTGAWGLVLMAGASAVGFVTVIGGLVGLVFTLLHWTK
jgi:hypothetical protein